MSRSSLTQRWRTGEPVGRGIYTPSGQFVGVVDYPEVAETIVMDHNTMLTLADLSQKINKEPA